MQTLEIIIKNSPKEPIIIIQGDHGSWNTAYAKNSATQISDPNERMPILRAYYVPKKVRENLYPTISPVNSFRIILKHLFDEPIDILEDKSYFSWYGKRNDVVAFVE